MRSSRAGAGPPPDTGVALQRLAVADDETRREVVVNNLRALKGLYDLRALYPANREGDEDRLRRFAQRRVAGCVVAGCALAGCAVVGPASISNGRAAYTDVITHTNDQQLLNMIVRTRYTESATLLQVASITAQSEMSVGAGGP